MKKLIITFFTAAVFSAAIQATHATTITFDEPGLVAGFGPNPYFPGTPKGTEVTDQFTALGVIFSINANNAEYVSTLAITGGLGGPSGGNLLAVNTTPFDSGERAILTARFIDPTGSGSQATVAGSSFSVFVADTEQSVRVSTFGLDGSLLEVQNMNTQGSILNFSTGQIARVEFLDLGGDGHTIDDFTFGQISVVPEPSMLILFSSGLIGVLLWRNILRKDSSVVS